MIIKALIPRLFFQGKYYRSMRRRRLWFSLAKYFASLVRQKKFTSLVQCLRVNIFLQFYLDILLRLIIHKYKCINKYFSDILLIYIVSC